MRVNKDLWRALKDIMPSENYTIHKVSKNKDIYTIYAEDEDYHYRIEILLTPQAEDHRHRLLDFSYEEKREERIK